MLSQNSLGEAIQLCLQDRFQLSRGQPRLNSNDRLAQHKQVLAPLKAVRLEKPKKGPSPNLAYMAGPDWPRGAQS